MNAAAGWTQKLGAISCGAFVLAVLIYVSLAASKDYHPFGLLGLVGTAVLGSLSGVAGLFASRGQGRVSVLSLMGCILNLPMLLLVLLLMLVMFGHRS